MEYVQQQHVCPYCKKLVGSQLLSHRCSERKQHDMKVLRRHKYLQDVVQTVRAARVAIAGHIGEARLRT
jgi:hypothetical protein